MTGLVLEGGTFRPIFSSGVMDALLEHDIILPYCIGVSAGITDAFSYISRQKKRNLDILMSYRHDKRYMGFRNFITSKSLFGLDFAYDEIPNHLRPFDWDTFYEYQGILLVGVTNALTGESVYLNGMELDEACTMLRATCAIPLLFPEIRIQGVPYYDGGLRDPIPVRKALEDGCDKLLIVLTRTKEYRKKREAAVRLAARVLRKRYPALEPLFLTRHEAYNETLEYCEELERQGRAVRQIRKNYEAGFRLCEERMDEIRAIL